MNSLAKVEFELFKKMQAETIVDINKKISRPIKYQRRKTQKQNGLVKNSH